MAFACVGVLQFIALGLVFLLIRVLFDPSPQAGTVLACLATLLFTWGQLRRLKALKERFPR